MIRLTALVYLRSDKSLEEVGKIVSKELFSGLEFGGKDKFIRDEIPAIYIENSVLGLAVILQGVDGDGVFALDIYPEDHPAQHNKEEVDNSPDLNLTEYVGSLLRKVEGIRVMADQEIEEFESRFN